MQESRNPDDETAYNDERNDEQVGIVSSTGESMELWLPPARYTCCRRSRPEPQRDLYIKSTPGLVKFVLEVEDPSPSLVQERVDQLSKPRLNRPLTPPRVRNPKMKELASFFESPANNDCYECWWDQRRILVSFSFHPIVNLLYRDMFLQSIQVL